MSDIFPITVSDTEIFSERGYLFNRLLGEGSYAKVWLVNYQDILQKKKACSLACKIVDSKKAPRDFINKFLPREMDILAKISHPHLIHLHSIYQRKTKFFIFMRFAEKGDLLDHILAFGEVKENQARVWTRQLSLGLHYLHQLDIVHRDIKCENVLITANNNVKLADFGFSRFMADASGKTYLSTTYCGSLAYAAPELLKGKPYDPKHSDIWSLGIVLYVMLNQCMPFNETDMRKLYELQVNSKWTFRSKIAQIISEDVKTLICCMLEPNGTQRIDIENVCKSPWFAVDSRLIEMSQREKEALDVSMNNKAVILPKTQKLTIPSWKKRKKDEQIVCVTSLSFERSSIQFTFDNAVKTQGEQITAMSTKEASMSKTKTKRKRSDDKAGRSKSEVDNVKPENEKRKTKESITLAERPKEEASRSRGNVSVLAQNPSHSKAAITTIVGPQLSRTDKGLSVVNVPPTSETKLNKINQIEKPGISQASGFVKPTAAATCAELNIDAGLNPPDTETTVGADNETTAAPDTETTTPPADTVINQAVEVEYDLISETSEDVVNTKV